MLIRSFIVFLIILIFVSCSSEETSQENNTGILDTSFAGTGYVMRSDSISGKSISLDSSGNVYITGTSDNDMAIWKYNSAGSLVSDFNSVGMVSHNSAAGGSSTDEGYSIVVDDANSVYVTGYSYNGSNNDMAIWKYTSSGSLDTSFSSDGIVTHNGAAGGSGDDYGKSIAIDNNGNIYVTGYSYNGSNYDMTIWKYNSSGDLDTSFDFDGIVSHESAAGGTADDMGNAIDLDDSGNVYVTGYSHNGSDYDMVIWKYNSSGALDTSFHSDGILVYNYESSSGSSNDIGYSIVIDNGGNIYVSGVTNGFRGSWYSIRLGDDSYSIMTIWKYNSSGELDTSFDSDGIVTDSNSKGDYLYYNDYAYSMVLDSSGNIFVTGNSDPDSENGTKMTIWKYNSSGNFDSSFGSNGVIDFNFNGAIDIGYSLAIYDDKYIYVTGQSDSKMTVWKYK